MPVVDFGKLKGTSEFLKRSMARFGIEMDIGAAIAGLAGTIRDHAHFSRLITETEPEFRQTFYDAVRPHLQFQAEPLDKYIIAAKQMAERQQLPVLMADGTFKAYQPPSAVTDDLKFAENMMAKALAERTLTLTCHECAAEAKFYGINGETKAAVLYKARRAGWVYTPVAETETCPKCAVPLAS